MPRGNEKMQVQTLKERQTRGEVDLQRIREAVRQILVAVGENPDREGLQDTPSRVARAYAEMFDGLRQDPGVHLARTFEQESEDLVVLRDIEFASTCEHHLLPVVGRVHIAYLPSNRRVVGLSKLARTVEVFARRPQLQERFTAQIADALMQHLAPQGVAVVAEAEHFCMKVRGVRKDRPVMSTSVFRGVFAQDWRMRQEVLSMLGVARAPISPPPDLLPMTAGEQVSGELSFQGLNGDGIRPNGVRQNGSSPVLSTEHPAVS